MFLAQVINDELECSDIAAISTVSDASKVYIRKGSGVKKLKTMAEVEKFAGDLTIYLDGEPYTGGEGVSG